MTPYERLTALLDAPGNRHGPDRACEPVSVAGGRIRYAWIDRDPIMDAHEVTLFGHRIATAFADGQTEVSTAGYFTPSTRDALAFILGGYGWQGVSLTMPGSKGGPSTEQTAMTIHLPGGPYVLADADWLGGGTIDPEATGHQWLTIPPEAFA